MSRSPVFARLLWKDAWVLWPLTLALCGMAIVLYLLVPLLPEGHSQIYSAWLLLFPNLFALGAPQLQVGQEEEAKTFSWARSLPIPWRTAFTSNVLTAAIGLVTVWIVCGTATYIAYLSGDFRFDHSLGYQGTWAAELYRVLTFSGMLLGLGYLCSWYFRSALVALIAVVPTAFLSVGLTHLISGWIADSLLTDSSAAEFREETFLIGHTNILLGISYGMIGAYLARRRWTLPESERGSAIRSSASTPYRPAPQLTTSKPSPTAALLWQTARQSSVAILSVCGVLLLSFCAILIIRHYSLAEDYAVMVVAGVLFSIAVLGAVAFGGDHARDRHRFLAELGLSRWQVWWTRLVIPLLVVVAAVATLWTAVTVIEDRRSEETIRVIAMMGMAVFGIGQLTGMWIRRPAVAIGSAVILFLTGLFLAAIYEFYESFFWTGWVAISALFLASLSMCRRWMDRDRGPMYHAGMAGWLGVAAAAVFLPIIAVRWWTTPLAMPEWRERTLAAAAHVVDSRPSDAGIIHVNVEYPGLPHLARENLVRLQESFADAADEDGIFPIGYDLPGTVEVLLRIARGPQLSEGGQLAAAFAQSRFEMETMGGVEKWYADLLSFAIASAERLPELGYILRHTDQADHYEQMAVKELESPESIELLGAERWRGFVHRLRTAEQRKEDRRNALLASYEQYSRESRDSRNPIYLGQYWPHSVRAQSLPWERARSRRWMDAATRISLEQLAAGLPEEGSPANRERMQAWAEALDSPSYAQQLPTRHWTTDLDHRAEALKKVSLKKVSDTFLGNRQGRLWVDCQPPTVLLGFMARIPRFCSAKTLGAAVDGEGPQKRDLADAR